MNDLTATAITSNKITSNATAYTSNTITSSISDLSTIIGEAISSSYIPTSYYNAYTTSTVWPPAKAKLETDSNELKINIKKFQIKFNFNL